MKVIIVGGVAGGASCAAREGQAMTLGIHYYRNVVRPDSAGADQVRFMVVMLFPKR